MEMKVKIKGLKSAMKAMKAAFPDSPLQQRRLLNQTMSGAARKSIIPVAKQMAFTGDSSGALSEAIAPRAVSLARTRSAGKAAIIDITPVRSNRKAMALYANFYYTQRGKAIPAKLFASGIRHGHLIEFGTSKISAKPFLWPAAVSEKGQYINLFARTLKKRIASAVKRQARKRG